MILDTIVADKKIRLTEQKKHVDMQMMRRLAENAQKKGASFYEALKKPGISIIGEFKMASPSLGAIKSSLKLEDRIDAYNASVDAISCLTEEDHFHGTVAYFETIRKITSLPMIRKDFMIDPYQFYEAKAIGADAVLFITAILDDAQMRDFYSLTKELGMDALVEVHNEQELERALKLDADIIGVNNRDLRDFTIRLDTTKRLSSLIPPEKVFVAESGIVSDKDVAFLKTCKVDGFLIGRAFMEADCPRKLAEKWKEQ